MGKIITIPDGIKELQNSEELTIDMSDLRFDCPPDKQKFYSFIFIRNSGIDLPLNFEKCSYSDKEEFLIMFLTVNININCPIMASTWIEILSSTEGDIYLPSILTKEEIKLFIERNLSFVNNIHQFINSLPLCAIYKFCSRTNNSMGFDEFKATNYAEIKLVNFHQLTEYDSFILLLNHNPINEHKPVFYTEIFTNPENSYDLMLIMNKLPYINLLITMFADQELQNQAIAGINSLLEP